MSATRPFWVLLRLPWQRYLPGMTIMSLLLVGAWALPFFVGKPKVLYASLGIHAYALMFVSMFSAMVWSSVCRPETQTLPRFRTQLLRLWAVYGAFLILMPALVTQIWLGAHGTLVGSGLLLIAATATATGSGMKWATLVWFVPMLLGIWPSVARELWNALLEYPLAPLPIAAGAALILLAVWRRLTVITDQTLTLSPADISASDLRHGPEAMRANATGLSRKLIDLGYSLSASAFDAVLARLSRGRPGARQRALQMVLMPALHWRGVLLELLVTAAFGGVVLWALGAQRNGPPPMGMAASYIGVITAMRFQQLHRVTLILRPSLTDVYLALTPPSHRAFALEVARALRGSLVSALISAALLLILVGVLMYPAELRLPLLVGGLLGAAAASLFGLGVVLLLLDAEKPRVFAGLFALGLLAAPPTSSTALAAMHSLPAGIATGCVWIVVAAGFLAYAERQVARWGLRFDAPL
ncbi:MAG: hypothetical protein U1F26_14055 [Lysobacterales bacterium]